jgi:hypothetical protein
MSGKRRDSMGGRAVFACAAAVIASAVMAASASAVTSYSTTATGSPNAGSKKSPAPFGGNWLLNSDAGPGVRPATQITWAWAWEGVVVRPQGFPVCTAAQIDAVQSDSICPAKSLIGTPGRDLIAQFGPAGDPLSNADCLGKKFRIYNAGPGAMTLFIFGPGSSCGGLEYLPPIAMNVTTKNNTSTMTVPWLPNITHPLPGIDAALNSGGINFTVAKAKVKKKGKTTKSAYLQSVGCSGTREFTFTVVNEENGSNVAKTSAGKCKQPKKKKKKK